MSDYSVRETVGDRLQVIARPLTLPGVCAVCGYAGTNAGDDADKRVFLDFQLDVDFYGRVYFCSTCLRQAANALSWLSLDQSEKLTNKIATQESELIVLREQNERLRGSLASLLGRSDDPSIPVLLGDTESVGREGKDSQGTDVDSQSEQLTLDESPSVEGPNSVSTDFDGLGEFRI